MATEYPQVNDGNSERHKRPVVIDGQNVSVLPNQRGMDTKRCIAAIRYFRKLGHTQINVVFPRNCPWDKKLNASGPERTSAVRALEPFIVLSPARFNNDTGQWDQSDDDKFILDMAGQAGAVVVSNDQFRKERDFYVALAERSANMNESEQYRAVVEAIDNRLLAFTITFDNQFQVARDPLGRHSTVTLDEILHFPTGYRPSTFQEQINELANEVSNDPVLQRQLQERRARYDAEESGSVNAVRVDDVSSFPIRAPGIGDEYSGPRGRESPVRRNNTFPQSFQSDYETSRSSPPRQHRQNFSDVNYSNRSNERRYHYEERRGFSNNINGRASRENFGGSQAGQRSWQFLEEDRRALAQSGFAPYLNRSAILSTPPSATPPLPTEPEDPNPPLANANAPRTRTTLEMDRLTSQLLPLVLTDECTLGVERVREIIEGVISHHPTSTDADVMAIDVMDEVQKKREEHAREQDEQFISTIATSPTPVTTFTPEESEYVGPSQNVASSSNSTTPNSDAHQDNDAATSQAEPTDPPVGLLIDIN